MLEIRDKGITGAVTAAAVAMTIVLVAVGVGISGAAERGNSLAGC